MTTKLKQTRKRQRRQPLRAARGSAATCEWYKGPKAKQCHKPATHEVLAEHWQKPVPVCDHHADIARGFGFQVRQTPEMSHEHSENNFMDQNTQQPSADQGAAVLVGSGDLLAALRCLRLLQECPPTVRQIIEAGDRAIDAAGINPWAMNEGLATGEERHTPWQLEDCIQKIASAISSANIPS